MPGYTDYILDDTETEARGVPCYREKGRDDSPLLLHDAVLPDGVPVWGHAVRSVRTALGATQGEVADALGVHWRTVQKWELGEVTPGARKAALYWRALLAVKPKG